MHSSPEPIEDRKLTPWKGFTAVFTAVFCVIMVITALITMAMPKTYVGVARVSLQDSGDIENFRSNQTLTEVALKTGFHRALAETFGDAKGFKMERTLEMLRRSLDLKLVSATRVLEVKFYHRDARQAAEMANAIAKAGCSAVIAAASPGGADPLLGKQDNARAHVMDAALPAMKPARPNRVLNFTFGAVVGLILGLMAGGVGARVAIGLGRDLKPPVKQDQPE